MNVHRRALMLGLAGLALPLPARAADQLKIRDLWAAKGEFSHLAQSFTGKPVEMRGYMAPPLKPEIDFFVLTRIPMAVCPFCDSEAAWPNDLIVVYMDKVLQPVSFNDLINVTGTLELGTKTDTTTGFVSRIRLINSAFALV